MLISSELLLIGKTGDALHSAWRMLFVSLFNLVASVEVYSWGCDDLSWPVAWEVHAEWSRRLRYDCVWIWEVLEEGFWQSNSSDITCVSGADRMVW
jgi:hypothetical protein